MNLEEEIDDIVFDVILGIKTRREAVKELLDLHSVSDLFINAEYLMELHPELNKEEAESLKEYAASRTIEYKECYGDGSIIYPKWKKENNR